MQRFSTERLRNIVLLSHGGTGKTSLAESLLFATGATTRMGRVEDGNTSSDYEPEEVKRGSSTQMSLVPCLWSDHKINVIDTPGYADFRGEVVSGLRVADGAVVLVAAPSGIEVGTEHAWSLLDERATPRIVFVNKMDRENADFQGVLAALQQRFGRSCVATHIPVGAESSFRGIIDLLSGDDHPAELAAEISAARELLTEAAAESDDDLATKYLEGEDITNAELREALRKGVAAGQVIPVIPGSATSSIGVKELLQAVVEYIPSPSGVAAGGEESPAADPGGKLAALVFKTSADPYVGRISYFRVYSGTFQGDSQVWNSSKGPSGARRATVHHEGQDPGTGRWHTGRRHRRRLQARRHHHRRHALHQGVRGGASRHHLPPCAPHCGRLPQEQAGRGQDVGVTGSHGGRRPQLGRAA